VSRGRALLALQERDERIAALRREVATLEAALRGDPELERLRQEAAAAEAARREADLAGHRVEMDLAEVRHRAATLDRRLYDGSVRNPQELLGMQHDLESLRPRIEELEGRLLQSMEVSEGAEAALRQARAAVAEREEERRSLEAPRRERLAQAREELAEVEEGRAAAAAAVAPADLRVYQRVAALRQPAVVHLVGDSCGGCHLPLSVREVSEARHGEGLVQCSRCDRVVVR
jgi:predicted  nucleic acid-binding Zn-ribbon protein